MSATAVQTAKADGSSPEANRAYRPDIDGLRAIAILSVVLHHAGVPFLPGGFTGVDIFFVISGYLIGGQIYANIRRRSFSYLRFYQHRARRILPAFFTVLIFALLVAFVFLSPDEARLFSRDAASATLSASNIFFWKSANYFDTRTSLHPLLMTWSLGVEEQFYLVIPLLMVLLAHLRHSLILPAIFIVCVLSLALAAHDVRTLPMQAFYLLPDRAWELGVGVALAVIEFDRPAFRLPAPITQLGALIGLALILAPFFLLNPHSAFPGLAALPSVLGTAILIALPTSLINRHLLALAPLVFIGRVSYSFYLWHWPLLSFLSFATADSPQLIASLSAVALAFILAVLSWRFIEQPFRRSKTPPVPLLLRYAAVSAVLLACCAAYWFAYGFPKRFPVLAAMEAPTNALQSDPCLAASQQKPNLTAACYPAQTPTTASAPTPTPIVALWGDSHAAALAPGLRILAANRGYDFAELTKNSCTPLIGATHTIPRIPAFAVACRRFNHATFSVLQSDPRIRVVIIAASWSAPFKGNWMDGWLIPDPEPIPASAPSSAAGSAPAATSAASPQQNSTTDAYTTESNLRLYKSALYATIHALQSAGKQVILVQDEPSFAVDPLMLVRTAHIPIRRALAIALTPGHAADPADPASLIDPAYFPPESSPEITQSRDFLQQASQQLSTQLFDPRPTLCPTPDKCAYRDGDTLLYIDTTHLSTAGATRVTAAFPLPAAH